MLFATNDAYCIILHIYEYWILSSIIVLLYRELFTVRREKIERFAVRGEKLRDTQLEGKRERQ